MNNPLATLFEQFLKERTYLKNVTPATLRWYRIAFKSYRKAIPDDAAPLPTRATLQEFVIRLRDRGVPPITCNTYVVAMNAFCAWLHEEGHAPGRVKLPKLRVGRLYPEKNPRGPISSGIGPMPNRLRPPDVAR